MQRPTLHGVPAMPILTASLIVLRAHVEEAGPLAALLGRVYPKREAWEQVIRFLRANDPYRTRM
jgi:hypothetical protein